MPVAVVLMLDSIAKSYNHRGGVFLNLLGLMACSVLLHGYYSRLSLHPSQTTSAKENPPSSDLASHPNSLGNQDHVGNFSTQSASIADESQSSAKENPSKSKTVPVAVAQICIDDVCADDIVGEWVLDQNKTFAAPVCCSWDEWKANPAQCGTTQIKSAGWYEGLPDRYQQVGGHACTCKGFDDKYTWRSSQELPDWKASETCRLLGNRTVVMIGDSTMQQLASTLMNSIFPVGCQTQIKMALSDTLIGKALGVTNRGIHWLKAVAKAKPDIVIISAGAHVTNNTDFYRLIDTVTKETGELKKKHPNVTVVWKTQSPAGCSADITFPKPSGKIFNQSIAY
jgi:hypothetical protein